MLNQSSTQSSTKIWNKNYIILLVVNTVAYLSFQILMPLIPVYGLEFTSSESMIGILAAAIAVAALLFRPISGVIADRFSRKKIIILMQFATAIIIICYIYASSIEVLIVTRFVQGLFFSLVSTVLTVSAIQTIPEDKMGHGIGIMGVSGIGSQAFAPAIGLYITENWGYTTMFVFVSIIALLAGFLAFAITLKNTPVPATTKFSFKNVIAINVIGVSVISLFFSMGNSVIASFMVLFSFERNIANIAMFFTIFAIVLVVTRVFFGKFVDKYPFQNITYFCAVLCIATLVIIATSHQFYTLAIAAVLMGFGYGLASPALQTEAVRRVSPEQRGTAIATYYLFIDLSFIAGPIGMGYIAEFTGSYSTGFLMFCIPIIVAIPMAYAFSRKKKQL